MSCKRKKNLDDLDFEELEKQFEFDPFK